MTKHSQIDLMDDDEFEDPETSQDPASQKFVEELYQFMEKRGTPIPSKLPQLGKRTLDLYRLFKEVYVRGGYDASVEKKLWREITAAYKVPKTCTSASHTLKLHYSRWIYPYEQIVLFRKPDPMTPEEIRQEQERIIQQEEKDNVKRSSTRSRSSMSANASSSSSGGSSSGSSSSSSMYPNMNSMMMVMMGSGSSGGGANYDLSSPMMSGHKSHGQQSSRSTGGSMMSSHSEKRSWSQMGSGAVSGSGGGSAAAGLHSNKRARLASESRSLELVKQLECSLDCQVPKHLDWALMKIAQISCGTPQLDSFARMDGQNGFRIDSIRMLLSTLIRVMHQFIAMKRSRKEHSRDDSLANLFNEFNHEQRILEERAMIALNILRNCSFVPYNQRVLLYATAKVPDEDQRVKLLDLLLECLNPDQYYIDWRMKAIDIFINCGRFLRLGSDDCTTLLFDRLQQCICHPDNDEFIQMKANAVEVLDMLISTKELRTTNIAMFEQMICSDKYRDMLWSIIDTLKTPTPIHHINEKELDESDDERDEKEDEEDDEEDENEEANNLDDDKNEDGETEFAQSTQANGTTLDNANAPSPVAESITADSAQEKISPTNTDVTTNINATSTMSDATVPTIQASESTPGTVHLPLDTEQAGDRQDVASIVEEQEVRKEIYTLPQPQALDLTQFETLNETELLCRSCALNMMMRLVTYGSALTRVRLANTNCFIQRLIQIMVWKSGLQSRMKSADANIYNMLSHPHRHRHIEQLNGSEKVVTDEDDEEDFDQDEAFDDYGDVEIVSMVTNISEYQKLSSSHMLQTKCAYIISQIAKQASSINDDDKNVEEQVTSIVDLLQAHEPEITSLVLYSNPLVSQNLVTGILSLNPNPV